MSVERKVLGIKKEKSTKVNVPTKKVKKSVDLSVFQDAISENKLVSGIGVGTELIAVRKRDGRIVYSACVIKEITADGLVSTWDETLNQYFNFRPSENNGVIKVTKLVSCAPQGTP